MTGTRVPSRWLDDVLFDLLIERERYGYELSAAVQRAAEAEFGGRVAAGPGGGDQALPEGAVYPALRRLEQRGLLLGRWVEIGDGVPRRRYYSLTPEGRRVVTALGARRQSAAPRSISAARA